jgi:Peptidase M50B-like
MKARFLLPLFLTASSWWWWDSVFLLPVKLLAVMSHETGHALATLLVGGQVKGITIEIQEAGQCLSLLPDSTLAQVVVSSGGYLGSLIFALGLTYVSFRTAMERAMTLAVALWLGAVAFFLAQSTFTLTFSLAMALVFAALSRWAPSSVIRTVNSTLALLFVLYALVDLKLDLWNSEVRGLSDAGILARATHIPSLWWSVVWTVAAMGILGIGARLIARPGLASALAIAKSDKVRRG